MKKKIFSTVNPRRDNSKNNQLKKATRHLMNIECAKLQVNVASHLHKQFKSACSKNGMKMSDVIMECIKNYLEKNK